MAQGVGGGTRIGGILAAFNAHYAKRLVSGRSVVIASPVALTLALLALGPQFGFAAFAADPSAPDVARDITVATQGPGDEAALKDAQTAPATCRAFVGSRAKTATLSVKPAADVPPEALAGLHAPAGLDLGAITPEEIAMSILAQMISHRRQGQRLAQRRS